MSNMDRVIAVRNTKTVFRDGDRCIKMFDEHYTKADVLNEALNLARIEETGLHVPAVLEVSRIDGKWALITEYIKGKTLTQLMEAHPEDKNRYIEQLVDLQVEVHGKKCPQLGKLKDKMATQIALADLDATTRYDLYTRLEGMPNHTKICHGDFRPSNVIITEDGTPYIVDWSQVTQGNASADAARTYLLFRFKGDVEGSATYLDLFCKKSEIDPDYVRKWVPIVAASQSVRGKIAERGFFLEVASAEDYH